MASEVYQRPNIDYSMWDNRRIRSTAIREFCRQCVCGRSIEIKYCTDLLCPLWSYRMGKILAPTGEKDPGKVDLLDRLTEEAQREMASLEPNSKAHKAIDQRMGEIFHAREKINQANQPKIKPKKKHDFTKYKTKKKRKKKNG